MAKTWQEAVVLARKVRAGEVPSYGLAAIDLADYIIGEQEQIIAAIKDLPCPDVFTVEETPTSPETPVAKISTNPYPPPLESDSLADEGDTEPTTYFYSEIEHGDAGPKTGVLAAPQTGVRTREVLPPPRHNEE